MNYNPFGALIFFLLLLWFAMYCWVNNKQQDIPAHQNLPPRKISIGYDFDKVGNDSVLVIQGKFVRENGGRVYVKVN